MATPAEAAPDGGPVPGTAWVLTEGKAGMVNQALGLAEAMGCADIHRFDLRLRAPWRQLTPYLWAGGAWSVARGPDMRAPVPDIAIGCGRQAIPPLLALRRRARGRCFAVYVQDPRLPLSWFDAVVAPRHDRLAGPTLVETLATVHRVTPAGLAAVRAAPDPRMAALAAPRLSVLLGGASRVHRLGPATAHGLGRAVGGAARGLGASVAVSASRRTPAGSARAFERGLREAMVQDRIWVWDGGGDNPYWSLLAGSDAVLVTQDSVTMIAEAQATGRPVYALPIEGGSAKFRRFEGGMVAAGRLRPFAGTIDLSPPAPGFDDAAQAAERVLALWRARLTGGSHTPT